MSGSLTRTRPRRGPDPGATPPGPHQGATDAPAPILAPTNPAAAPGQPGTARILSPRRLAAALLHALAVVLGHVVAALAAHDPDRWWARTALK